MKGTMAVFRFTFLDQVRKKSYIISTVILVLLVIAALCVPSVVKKAQSGGGSSSKTSSGTLYVIDPTGIAGDGGVLSSALSGYSVVIRPAGDRQELTDEVKSSSSKALAVLRNSGGAVAFDYYVKGIGDGPDPEMLSAVFEKLHASYLLTQGGVPASVQAAALSNISYSTHTTGRGMLDGFLPAIAVSILLFMSIYMYGYWVATSIASEKTSRVMELLITSTKPSKIVVGKSLAMGLLGLLQLLIVIAAAIASYQLAYPKNFSFGGLTIDFSAFTPFYAVMLVLYFLLGFALYAMINAVAGATVSNAEDVRTAVAPVSVIAVISFYFAYGSMMLPDSSAARAASLIPFSAPFSMPPRILMTEVPAWQIAASFALLAAVTVLMAWISIRLYSAAVLHYGKKLKISELVAMTRKP